MLDSEQHDQLVEQAAQWLVLLTADDEETRSNAQHEFEQWKKQSQHHADIAADLEKYLQPLQQISENQYQKRLATAAIQAGLKTDKKRRHIKTGGVLAIGFLLAGSTYLYFSVYSIGYMMADVKNPNGQWKTQVLPDGSKIILRGATALNLDFSSQQRNIRLLQGEIYVDVAKDKNRPFVVHTPQGSIQALGTVFTVEQANSQYTTLKMLHSSVNVKTAQFGISQNTTTNYSRQMIVQQGQRVDFYSDKIIPLAPINIEQERYKWQKHEIVFENSPLDQVLQQLNKNYHGKIFYSHDMKDIYVNAVLPLDKTEEALKLLLTALPDIKVVQITPYIVYVSKK